MSDELESQKNKGLALIFIGLATALVVTALLYDGKSVEQSNLGPSESSAAFQQKKREDLERAVNKHIQMTNRKIEIDKEKIKQEAVFTIPQVGQIIINPNSGSDPIDMRGDRNELNPVRDLRRGSVNTPSAGDLIHQEMADNEARQRQNEQYMKEYAKQFVENARRNGYEVELSSDYKVLNVRQVNPGSGTDTGLGQGPAFR